MTADTEARLTEAQRRALTAIGERGIIWSQLNTIGRWNTINVLIDRGWIEDFVPHSSAEEMWGVTDAGRAALARKEG